MQDAKRPGTRTSRRDHASAASARKAGRWMPERAAGGGAPSAGPTCVPMMRSAAAAMKPSVTGWGSRTRNLQPGGGEQQSEDADHQGQRGGELDIGGREGVAKRCSEPSTRTVITPTGPVNSRRLLPNATARAGAAQLA